MKYIVRIKKTAEKEHCKIPKPYFQKILEAMVALGDHPRPIGHIKLQNRDEYRIRVGYYRILYFIDESKKEIEIVSIGHRKEVYK